MPRLCAFTCRSYKHAGVLLHSLELCYNQLVSYIPDTSSSSSGSSSSREDLLVQCGMLMLGVMQCPGYQGKTGSMLTTSKDKERVRTDVLYCFDKFQAD